MNAVGDSHNFGRRVTKGEASIDKPRTVFWEWLFLCTESPLRAALLELAEREGLPESTFSFLPSLAFSSHEASSGGRVERLSLEPLVVDGDRDKHALAQVVGRAVALFSFFGLADLHWENLVIGVDPKGATIVSPIDVEMVLGDLPLPTHTKLIPDSDPEIAAVCQHAAGLRRVLPFLGKPVNAEHIVSMVGAYRRTLRALGKHASKLGETLARLPVDKTPIRVLLRGTDEYVERRFSPPLLAAEEEQLARGDIPYFFRFLDDARLLYFQNEALTQIGEARGGPPLDRLLSPKRELRSSNRKQLAEEGSFTLIGAFDHPGAKGRHESDGVSVTFRKKTLLLELGKGEELEARRDLSSFVSSVYTPCACGEVASVFVPEKTRCTC